MTDRAHWRLLADYNAWANDLVYAAAAKLSDADYRADRGAFFKSIHGTLNHLLTVDRIWTKRLTGQGEAPDRLDAMMYDAFEPLRAARRVEDDNIVAFVETVDFARPVLYSPLTGVGRYEQDLAPLLTHMFNHQTHHRGQIHALLTGLVGEAPSLDLLAFQRETGRGIRRVA